MISKATKKSLPIFLPFRLRPLTQVSLTFPTICSKRSTIPPGFWTLSQLSPPPILQTSLLLSNRPDVYLPSVLGQLVLPEVSSHIICARLPASMPLLSSVPTVRTIISSLQKTRFLSPHLRVARLPMSLRF